MKSRASYSDAEKAVRDAYDVYPQRFLKKGYRFNTVYLTNKALSDWSLLAPIDLCGKQVLNVGCAEPIDELQFGKCAGAWHAVDFSLKNLRGARQVLQEELSACLLNTIHLYAADASALPFQNESFDVVVAFSTLEHIPDPGKRRKSFEEIARVLRHGGYAVITTSNAWNLKYRRRSIKDQRLGQTDFGFECFYSPLELRRLLCGMGLRPLRFYSEWRMPNNSYILQVATYLFRFFGTRIGYLAQK
ncbi:MAG: class I SAM-dependent methyltransferase [Acidobacteriota bacterium]|nr:MAG: class I SAM-dependent methyltransferase [Acidobacteriota bacterium]